MGLPTQDEAKRRERPSLLERKGSGWSSASDNSIELRECEDWEIATPSTMHADVMVHIREEFRADTEDGHLLLKGELGRVRHLEDGWALIDFGSSPEGQWVKPNNFCHLDVQEQDRWTS